MSKEKSNAKKPVKTCCACGKSETAWKREGRETVIVSIFPLLYVRPVDSKAFRKMGGKVEICESCFTAILTGSIDTRAVAVYHGLINSLRAAYSAFMEQI